ERVRAWRQVAAGAQRTGAWDARDVAAVQQLRDSLEHHRTHAGMAKQQPVTADRHRGAHDLRRQLWPGPGGMAAQQVDLQMALELGRDRIGDQRTEPGRDAVY